MPHLKAHFEDNTCIVTGTSVIGVIEYDDKRKIEASLILGDTAYRAGQGADKNVVLSQNGTEVLKFKFDYLWGGAALIAEGEKTGYKITGKAFKKGSRLVDGEGNDMVVLVTAGDFLGPAEFEIEVTDRRVTDFLIVATVYYHIYASIGKTLGVIIS